MFMKKLSLVLAFIVFVVLSGCGLKNSTSNLSDDNTNDQKMIFFGTIYPLKDIIEQFSSISLGENKLF